MYVPFIIDDKYVPIQPYTLHIIAADGLPPSTYTD